MVTRRVFFGSIVASALIGVRTETFAAAPAIAARFRALEKESGGRLGIAALDSESGRHFGYRAAERFPLCSTFKLLAVGAVLARVDQGRERLQRRIRISAGNLINNSPVTQQHVGSEGMTLAELCAAAINYSDNTAANLILAALGGPPAVTAFARALGDRVTRLDRNEPAVNTAIPGDRRDTTSPQAILDDLRKLALGSALSPASRQQLIDWLLATKTGASRLRAGLPASWRFGHKTGSGDHGTANDVGIAWPPQRRPLLLAVYLTNTAVSPERQDVVHRAVAAAVAETISPP